MLLELCVDMSIAQESQNALVFKILAQQFTILFKIFHLRCEIEFHPINKANLYYFFLLPTPLFTPIMLTRRRRPIYHVQPVFD